MEEKRPFISIVMPVYNAAEYLEESLGSIAAQTFQDLEVIMVDDCSTDESLEICSQWEKKDARFKAVRLEKNGGAGHARNIGMKHASGVYLAFMDADDIIEPDLYEAAIDSLKSCKAQQVVWGVTEDYYDRKNKLISQNVIRPEEKYCKTAEEVRASVIRLEERTLFGYQWNRLYDMEIIRKNNIRFEDSILYEDYFFNLEVIKYIEKLNIISNAGYHYKKQMNQSITNRYVAEYFALSRRRVKSMYVLYVRWGFDIENVKEILGNIYLRYILSALMRNCDRRSCMAHKQRRQWVKRVYMDELYRQLIEKERMHSAALKILQMNLRMHFTLGCLILGRLTYWLKSEAPLFFSLLKKTN